jgi:hypothetical protein
MVTRYYDFQTGEEVGYVAEKSGYSIETERRMRKVFSDQEKRKAAKPINRAKRCVAELFNIGI